MQQRLYAKKITETMNLIYSKKLTSFSGGNLSIKDAEGNIWITPTGADKGNLKEEDIVCISKDNLLIGKHKPSIELPFHRHIYHERPDIHAILHAHPPALIAESLIRKIPDIKIAPYLKPLLGKISMAPYAIPGGDKLGNNIAEEFSQGNNAVILENHGVVIGAKTMDDAFEWFETLNFYAQTEIFSQTLGPLYPMRNEELLISHAIMDSISGCSKAFGHKTERDELSKLSTRIYKKGFTPSGFFSISRRLEDGSILISNYTKRLHESGPEDFYIVGNPPHDSLAGIHKAIYDRHPKKNCIITAFPPHIMAFACSHTAFDSRLIPESYLVMREVTLHPFKSLLTDAIGKDINSRRDIFLIQNCMVLICAEEPLKAYDKLEVLEFSAEAVFYGKNIGRIVHLDGNAIEEINQTFHI